MRRVNYQIGTLIEIRGRTVRLARGRLGWTSTLIGSGGAELVGPARSSKRETLEAMERLLADLDAKEVARGGKHR